MADLASRRFHFGILRFLFGIGAPTGLYPFTGVNLLMHVCFDGNWHQLWVENVIDFIALLCVMSIGSECERSNRRPSSPVRLNVALGNMIAFDLY